MSKTIMLKSRFWEDNYVSELNSEGKLLFLYCLTNPRISLSGIYEVPLRNIALDTGIDRVLIPDIFKKFEADKKIAYLDGWICIINYPKHQNYQSPTILKGVENEFKLIPSNIVDKCLLLGYPIDTLSIPFKGKVKAKVQVMVKGEERNFEKFWSEYPKKIGKKKAEQAFGHILAHYTIENILAGLAKWKESDQWKKEKGRYIPHPTTWINGERWNDEVEVKPTNNKYERYN
jgi:hypothetical protein